MNKLFITIFISVLLLTSQIFCLGIEADENVGSALEVASPEPGRDPVVVDDVEFGAEAADVDSENMVFDEAIESDDGIPIGEEPAVTTMYSTITNGPDDIEIR